MQPSELKTIRIYQINGKEPFSEWLSKLRNKILEAKVLRRIDRLALGNYGDHRYLNKGLFELKLDVGAGYRVYCGDDGKSLVVLLCGGDKESQSKDIEKAQRYWQDYLQRRKDVVL